MGKLVRGDWVRDDYDHGDDGEFQREQTVFRRRVGPDGDVPVESGRYHLYVSLACPWAHRTLITRAVKGLGNALSLSVVDPLMGEDGWEFSDRAGGVPDAVTGARFLRDVYRQADPEYTGRVTVPVLWDTHRETIVNNESLEIMRMFDTAFHPLAERDVDLFPGPHREEIQRVIESIYEPINNGVYRAGFAGTQAAYERAVTDCFEALDHWDEVLGNQRYLAGPGLTEADVCMFTTLYRFDAVYHTHFKCNIRRIDDYANLSNYLRQLAQVPAIRSTCDMEHVKHHYYRSHESLNPAGLVALGPELDFDREHNRGPVKFAHRSD